MIFYLSIFRSKMIFDFDDPIYTHTPIKTKIFCRMADAVIVCTHGQATWAKQFNRNVHTIHIAVDTVPYKKFSKIYGAMPEQKVIGWIGTGPEHMLNFGFLVPPLRRLVAQKIPFTFVLIGAFKDPQVYKLFQDIEGLDVRFIDTIIYTDPESAPREIQNFDIGVVPHRSQGEWNKSKTSLKVLEYMACSVPVVVSAFGEMPYIITDGTNGYMAASEDEWVEKLTRLLQDPTLRERLGRAGQQTVQERYSFDAILPQMVQVIDSL